MKTRFGPLRSKHMGLGFVEQVVSRPIEGS